MLLFNFEAKTLILKKIRVVFFIFLFFSDMYSLGLVSVSVSVLSSLALASVGAVSTATRVSSLSPLRDLALCLPGVGCFS